MKQFSIFDWIKCIIDTKPKFNTFTLEQKKLFNNYMILRFLSMNQKYIEVVNYVQGLGIKDEEKLYKVLCDLIPQSKQTYSPYIKSKIKSINSEILKYISNFYECSCNEAAEYVELMGKDWVKDILVMNGMEDKDIKKLMK